MPSTNQGEPTPPRGFRFPLLFAATVVILVLAVGSNMGYAREEPTAAIPLPITSQDIAVPPPPPIETEGVAPPPTASVTPTATPTPTPTPTPYDFAEIAPETSTVDMTWFEDAVFVGDSRTDGLRLYSGITGCDFFCSKGISVYDVMDNPDKKLITIDGEKYSILEALATDTYQKVYICLGINELGYYDDVLFTETFSALIDEVERLQPEAVIYLQTLVPVNEAKCRANNQPDYVTNDRVQDYNDIFYELAAEKSIVLIDLATGLVDEEGMLPSEATSDGVHFTKIWYEAWAEYLLCHTVDQSLYFYSKSYT